MAKSFDQVIGEMVDYVNGNIGDVDTRPATVLREAILGPVATQLVEGYTFIDQVQQNQTISSPDAISTDAMDGLAANFGLARQAGTPAFGYVRFSRVAAPAAPISIPSGTLCYTSSAGDQLSFATLNAAILSAGSPQDPVTNEYYVDVACEGSLSGTIGNIAAGSITVSTVAGVDNVTNPNNFTGGTDTQTNAQLASLIAARAQGNAGTSGGYESLIKSNFVVDDMAIISPTDPEAIRAQFGGSLDIAILTPNFVQSTETTPSSTTNFTPAFLPLIAVIEITGFDTGDVVQTMAPITDYDVILDTYSPLSRSYQERSYINFHVTSFAVKPLSVFTITYSNNQTIRTIQSFLDDQNNKIVGSDVLVKAAIEIDANVTADIRIIPGYDPDTVGADAVTGVTDYLAGKLLGESIQSSDIISVIAGTAGVDSVDLGTFKLANALAPLVYVSELVANKQDYIRAGTVIVTVVG